MVVLPAPTTVIRFSVVSTFLTATAVLVAGVVGRVTVNEPLVASARTKSPAAAVMAALADLTAKLCPPVEPPPPPPLLPPASRVEMRADRAASPVSTYCFRTAWVPVVATGISRGLPRNFTISRSPPFALTYRAEQGFRG
jgi:hypothetical protein